MSQWIVNPSDVKILRDLAKLQMEHAHMPVMDERRKLWYKHNRHEGIRPMILVELDGVVDEVIPVSCLKCSEPWARDLERSFRVTLYQNKHVMDDLVVDPFLRYNWQIQASDYGVPIRYEHGNAGDGVRGSYHWEPPIKDLDTDFEKLHHRSFSVDRESTLAWKYHLEDVFVDIIPLVLRGSHWWTLGMTWDAILHMGLENFMVAMYDTPEGMHRFMNFLKDDFIAFATWAEEEGLLNLNNENDYVGSGSYGFTHDLPQPGMQPGKVRMKDQWVLLESQETVCISPAMFKEFILPYQQQIAEKFGKVYYGCCEPVHNRWDSVKQIKNLTSVSVSPWCDQNYMAQALGKDITFSRKPNPTLISIDHFHEDEIRKDLMDTVKIAHNNTLEIIMKDVHTVKHQPGRLGRWVNLAREAVNRYW